MKMQRFKTFTLVPELLTLTEDAIEAYDALTKQAVLVICPLMCMLADNSRASELINHLGGGGAARWYCRMCMVSGSNIF